MLTSKVINKMVNSKLLLATVLVSTSLFATAAQAEATLAVTGTAELYVKPDQATVMVRAIGEAKTPAEARDKVEKAVNTYIAKLKELNFTDKDIIAQNITLSQNYNYIDGKRVFRDYSAQRAISVKVTDFANIAKVTDLAVDSGVTQIENISYSLVNEDISRAQVRSMAVKDAQQKAKSLAEGFATKIKGVKQINYHNSHGVVARSEAPVMLRASAKMMNDASAESSYYNPDDLRLFDEVSVIYELDDK